MIVGLFKNFAGLYLFYGDSISIETKFRLFKISTWSYLIQVNGFQFLTFITTSGIFFPYLHNLVFLEFSCFLLAHNMQVLISLEI